MGGEELDGGDAAKVAPVGPIASAAEGGVVVAYVLQGGEAGTVGEGDVVLREALVNGGRGRDDED